MSMEEDKAVLKVLEREYKGALAYLEDYGDAGLMVLKLMSKPCLKDKTGGIWTYRLAVKEGASTSKVQKSWVREIINEGARDGMFMIHGVIHKQVWITPIGSWVAEKNNLNDAKALVTLRKTEE